MTSGVFSFSLFGPVFCFLPIAGRKCQSKPRANVMFLNVHSTVGHLSNDELRRRRSIIKSESTRARMVRIGGDWREELKKRSHGTQRSAEEEVDSELSAAASDGLRDEFAGQIF